MTGELALEVSKPVVTPEQVELVASYLRGKGWVKGAVIAEALKIDDRRLRAIAEFSDGRIISGPGCPGYQLFTGEALADADLAASRLESQGKRMISRAIAIRRRFHHFPRATA
ncbi:MAG: hypothetical protein PHE83_05680 [Opitutaceae bacterium]|nr:hypothetical protein [Opitutaceae bacterium]